MGDTAGLRGGAAWPGTLAIAIALARVAGAQGPVQAGSESPGPASGETPAPDSAGTPREAAPATAGTPTAPDPGTGSLEWVRLKTGEWLPGEIDLFRRDELRFDSEEFDDVVLDWDDVVEVHSPRPNSYVREFSQVYVGPADIVGQTVTVRTADGPVVFPRSELTAILPGSLRELSRWSMHLGAAFDGNWGASRQATLSTHDWIQREDAKTRLRVTLDSTWGRATGTNNVNNLWGTTQFDLYVSHYFFFTPVFAQVGYDRFLNFDLRATPGSGVGVHLVDEPKLSWDLMGGGAYLYTRYVSVEPGSARMSHDGAVVLSTTLDWDITDDIDFTATHMTTLVVTDLGLTQFNTMATLGVDITDAFSFDTTFRHTRIRRPVTRASGEVPDQDLFQLLVGVSLDL